MRLPLTHNIENFESDLDGDEKRYLRFENGEPTSISYYFSVLFQLGSIELNLKREGK